MKVYTARHGQTSWNLEGRMQGHSDIPLNATGILQAEKLAEKFKDIPLCKIYTSDLVRAYETARIINHYHKIEICADAALREISIGTFEGQSLQEPSIAAALQTYFETNQVVPGGESIQMLFNRVHKFLDTIISHDNQNLLIVGHFGTIRAVICYFLDLSPSDRNRFAISNTAIHCFESDAITHKFSMITENDASHLD